MYEIGVRIAEYFDRITADYFFNCTMCMGFLKDVIAFADDIILSKNIEGFDIAMSIDYYTRAIYRKDKRIRP